MSDRDRRQELAQPKPGPQVLGTIASDNPLLSVQPQGTVTEWTSPDGSKITLTEPPPPWEVADHGYAPSDARRFVEVPPNWKLRWVNPRLLDSEGWRDWQALSASDPRVTVKVPTMVSPENYIRRGGSGGDILCWMWQGWYDSKIRLHSQRTAEQSGKAVEQHQQLKEESARGTFGPHVKIEGVTHPTHTMAEGKGLDKRDP